jgi:malate/lactate dehydrogenase
MDSIMLIGSAGSVGHDILYLMASMGRPMKVVGADFNEVKGTYEIEESLQIAHNLGLYPDFRFRKIDLFNIEQTAELIDDIKPKVICNLASLGSWWITRLLPDSEYKKIGPIGPWLPNHLTLTYKLMKAIKMTGLDIKVVNGAFPDATNVVLSKVGLTPTCGGGNMDIGIQRLKRIIARDRNVPFQGVTIYGVGHHGTFYTARYNGPFWVKIVVEGMDVTKEYPNEKLAQLYREAGYAASVQFAAPLVDQMKTAVSFLNNVLGIYYDTKKIHESVPGPEGLPGAYPARLSADGAQIVLPGISREKAIEINKAGGRIDGIEEIKDDGTVVYLDQNVQYMREVVGYECKQLKLEESEERAKELNTLLKKLYEKYKV